MCFDLIFVDQIWGKKACNFITFFRKIFDANLY